MRSLHFQTGNGPVHPAVVITTVTQMPQKTYLNEDCRLHRSLDHIVTDEIYPLVWQLTRITVRSLADLHLLFYGRQASLLYPDKLDLCFAG